MRTFGWIMVCLPLAACGSSDDGGGACDPPCGPGYVCDDALRICVVPDAGADGDADDAAGDDAPAETPGEADTPAETPLDAPGDDARIGPCAAAGGVCRGLVAGCAACADGEEPAPTTILCPPEQYCCVPRTAVPPYPLCIEQGGVCYPASSGSECPIGWRREDVDCGGPAGCCLPSDACV